MKKKSIRITVVKVFTYEPNLDDETFYVENGITTIEDAMEIDKQDVASGNITYEELAPHDRGVTMLKWEVIESNE